MSILKSLNDPQHLRDLTIQSMESAIRLILTVSTGTLALSITFRSSLIGDVTDTLWILRIAWIALSLVPMGVVVWYIFRGTLFNELVNSQLPIDESEKPTDKLVDRLCNWQARIYIFSLLAFVIGLLAFGSFAIYNLG